jgi:hypothetical protein
VAVDGYDNIGKGSSGKLVSASQGIDFGTVEGGYWRE